MKICKIIVINIIIMFFVWIFLEFGFYIYRCKFAGPFPMDLPFFNFSTLEKTPNYTKRILLNKIPNSTKKPIMLLGCSYTYGQWLDDKECFSYVLSQYTKRNVYNLGISSEGPITMLALLKKEELYPTIKEEPEYIIYTFMFHHILRTYHYVFFNMLRKDNLIPIQKYNMLYHSHIYQFFKDAELEKFLEEDLNRKYDLILNVIKKTKEESEKLYPNSKFVIMLYSDINYDLSDGYIGQQSVAKKHIPQLFEILYSQDFRKKIEDMNITVFSTEDLIGRKMNKKDDRISKEIDRFYPHPSAKVWKEIVPQLSKKLNL